ncbi:MAG: pyridoxal phosphate-dependent aminotransferase [Actinocatenispora sp.]
MTVSRLRHIPGIGVNHVGDRADAANDPDMLRLENLDTDIPPPAVAVEATRRAVDDDAANSYLPFEGHHPLRTAAAAHVSRIAGVEYDPVHECVSVAGGLNGILNTLLATVEPGREVVLADPIYAGLVNRIRLAGGVPRHVPAHPTADGWQTDPDELAAAIGPGTAAVLLMGPAMPTGALLRPAHLDAIAGPVVEHGAWVVYDAAMERIRFDGAAPVHPARHPGLADRTITVGSASKELRMIGWRVGWVVGPRAIMADVGLVGLTNVVCQVGIAQQAVAAALAAPDAEADVAAATATWRERCDLILDQLTGYPVVRPHGGWSLLVDTAQLGISPEQASQRLFEHGRVAATPMTGWGPSGHRYLRLVFANEPVERLADLRGRFDAALGDATQDR